MQYKKISDFPNITTVGSGVYLPAVDPSESLAINQNKKIRVADFLDSYQGFTQSGSGAVSRTITSKLRDVVSVKDFGAVGDGVADDTAAIQAAITACVTGVKNQLLIPPGVYRVSNSNLPGYTSYDNRIALLVDGASNLSISGYGATIRFYGTDRNSYAHSLLLRNCVRIEIKGITFDWEKLPYIQGVCSGKTASSVDFSIDTSISSPSFNDIQRVEEFNNMTRLWDAVIWDRPSGSGDTPGRPLSLVSGTTYSLTANVGDSTAGFTVGKTYVLTHQVYGAQAIQVENSTACSFTDIIVYASGGMGLRANNCTDLDLASVNILRNPSFSARLLSTTADGLHFSSCRGRLFTRNCSINNTGDDGIHVGTPLLTVDSIDGVNTFTATTAYPYIVPRQGDALEAIANDGSPLNLGTVTSIVGSFNPYVITMSQALPVGFTASLKVQNTSSVPIPEIRDCSFTGIRGQAVLVMAKYGRIINNSARKIAGGGIVCWSYPSYFGDGVIPEELDITGNLTEDCPRIVDVPAAIQVFSRNLNDTDSAPAGTINGITVANNVIRKSKNMALYLTGVGNSSVHSNSIYQSNLNPHPSFWDGWANSGYVIGGKNLSNVSIQNNSSMGSLATGIVGGTLSNVQTDLNNNLRFDNALPAFFARAWVVFSATGGVVSVANSGNVSSVVRDSAGVFTVTFTKGFPSNAYAVVGTCYYTGTWIGVVTSSVSNNSFQIYTAPPGSASVDPDSCYLVVYQ